jgi:hypothetical protein
MKSSIARPSSKQKNAYQGRRPLKVIALTAAITPANPEQSPTVTPVSVTAARHNG